MTVVTLDVETTTHNKGHVYDPRNFLVSYSYKINDEKVVFRYYTDADFITHLRSVIERATLFVGFNAKFDLAWLRRVGVNLPPGCRVFDCQLAEFILSAQTARYASLNGTCIDYGLPEKHDKVKEYWELGIFTEDIPVEILEEYNNWDVELTFELYLQQEKIVTEKQWTLILLEGLDLLTLLDAEWNGIKYDVETCLVEKEKYEKDLAAITEALNGYLPKLPDGAVFNWNSGDHLSALLYGGTVSFDWRTEEEATYKSGPNKGQVYQKGTWHSHEEEFQQRFKPLPNTTVKKCLAEEYQGTMFYQVDDPTLKQLKTRSSENKKLLELLDATAKKGKVLEMFNQFLGLIETFHWQDNIIHPQYNQNVAVTGRLSSSKPNGQNTPPELDKLLISRF